MASMTFNRFMSTGIYRSFQVYNKNTVLSVNPVMVYLTNDKRFIRINHNLGL